MDHIAYEHSLLNNGLQVISSYHPAAPVTTVTCHVAAGSRYERPDEFGYAHFAEHLTFDGTKRFPSRLAVGEEIDRLGALANAYTGKESIWWHVQAPSSLAEDSVALLAEMLCHSKFDVEAISHERQVISQEISRAEDDPMWILYKQMLAQVFGAHPLGHWPLGDPTVVASATPERVVAYYQRRVGPKNSVITVVGSLNHEQVVALVGKYFGQWNDLSDERQMVVPLETTRPGRNHLAFTAQRTCFSLTYLLPSSTERERSIGEVLVAWLAQGRSSMMWKKLRTTLGLTYDPNGSYTPFKEIGAIQLSGSSTQPTACLTALTDMMINPAPLLTAEEFQHTVQRLINKTWQQVYGTQLGEANFLGSEALLADELVTPDDWRSALAAVTYEETIATMRQFLKPAQGYLTVVGPEAVIE
ncbi:MAG: pitrilysin family protein [Patescibacteria group bacterium]